MSQHPDHSNPYEPDKPNPNSPGGKGMPYGGAQPPSWTNPPNQPAPGPQEPVHGGAQPPPWANQPSGPDPNMPYSNYGPYANPYAPPPPGPGSGPNPYNPYGPTLINPSTNPPTPYPPLISSPITPPPVTTGPRWPLPPELRKRVLAAAIALLLVILGGTIFGVTAYNNHQATLHANATATAQARVQATANAQATAYAQQTAVASTYPFSNKRVLDDPLTDNSKGVSWDEDGKVCFFSGSAYHAVDTQPPSYQPCLETGKNYDNFTFQADMVIKQGDDNVGGGLIFRADKATNKCYRLIIDDQGNYAIVKSVDSTGKNTSYLKKGTIPSSLFATGLNTTNTIGVVVNNDQISLYANRQLVTGSTFADSSYSQGEIGFNVINASTSNQNAEVTFSNVKVWQL